ncbi:MBG domain-containing protein [Flavobacterium sp.]|uniref:MBG domain-containing protein n=1 Tax=Flavobacterium sp. TaxID=239 RepID=UPI00286D83F3|nr:MBG domain-containing protein [Flavobacterium sp.]
MKIALHHFKLQAALLFLMMVGLANSSYGQSLAVVVGDYRSVASGNWSTAANWNICTSISPTVWSTTVNYPGQTATANQRVYIFNGDAITLDAAATIFSGTVITRVELIPSALTGTTSLTVNRNLTFAGALIVDESAGNSSVTISTGFTVTCQQGRVTNTTVSGSESARISIQGTGVLTCNTGSLQLQNGIVDFTGSGALNITGTTSSILLTGAAPAVNTFAGSTITFGGTNQAIPALAYQNLTLSGSLVKTIAATATVAGTLTISGTAQAALNTGTNYVVSTLTTTSGSSTGGGATWGSTTSAATNQSNTSFTATTGIVTVNGVLGDIRSNVSTGNWSTPATWQRYDGSAWVACTGVTPLGYPGQFALAQRVFIVNGHDITLDITPASAFNITRLEFPASTQTAASFLRFNSGVALSINGAVIMEDSLGNDTITVGTSSLTCPQMRLTNSTGAAEVSEINVSTGSVSITSTTTGIQLNGTTAKSIFRFTGSGTLSINQGITGGGAFIASTSTVTFGNFGTQTIPAYAFNNVTLSGSALKTVSATATIAGALSIATGCSASLGAATNYTIDSLILGGIGRAAGTWGGTGSGATNINTTFFAATTGFLTVGSSTPDITITIGSYTYNGLSQGPTVATNTGTGTSYTFSYRNSGGTAYGPSATPPTNAGNYFVTVTVAANAPWAARTSPATAFTIATAALTITANNGVKIIGATHTTGAGSTLFTSSGLQNGEIIGTITIASTGAVSTATEGTYPIVPSAAIGGTFTASNYTITYNIVTPGLLTVNPNSGDYRSAANGDWVTLSTWERWNGTAWAVPTVGEGYPTQTAAVTRLEILNGHNVTCGIGTSGLINLVGRLSISAGANDTSLTFTSTNYFEMKGNAPIALTSTGAGNALVDFGNANIYSFQQMLMTNSSTGTCKAIINNATPTFAGNITMSGTASQNIIQFDGSGTLKCGGTLSGGTIIAGTGTIEYNGAAQAVGLYAFHNLILSGSGIKTFNASTSVTRSLTISGTAIAGLPNGSNYPIPSLLYGTTGEVAGTYGSTASAATLANRSDTYYNVATTGILTVASNLPFVKPNVSTAYTYNGLPQGSTPTNSGTGTSYTYSYTNNGGAVYGPTATAPTNVGSYFVTVTVAADGVWLSNSSAVTGYSIIARAITITANDGTKLVGDTHATGAGSVLFTTSGLQNSETLSVTIASAGAAGGAAVGTYTIVPSAAIGGTFTASNYSINYVNGTLTVSNPTSGDYRSKASGNWNVLATWERWSGSAWVEPTALEGYPSQLAAPAVVYIRDGHDVVCNISIITANRPARVELSAGSSTSSLSVFSVNTFQLSGQLRIMPSTAAGITRTVNAGSGFIVAGSILVDDTGNDAIDSEITVSTGSVYAFGNIVMRGSSARNAVRFTGSGLLQAGDAFTGGTIVPSTGRVEFFKAGNQTVGAYTFTNLTLSGSGTKTLNSATVINENITMSGTAIASLNAGTTYTVNSLIYGTAGQPLGTYGSTSSAATNKTDTYFASTGILNILFSTPDITVTPIGTYIYSGVGQGPVAATNTGSGSSYTFSYRNSGGTTYGPSATLPTNVGSYTVTATVAANGVFVARTSTATAFAITQRPLTITANDGTKIYGSTYTTGALSTAFTAPALQNGETIGSITISSTGAVNTAVVGTYPIVPTLATGGTFTASNYSITYVNGTLIVDAISGDYRTVVSGNWNALATWERWNGAAWVTPTAPQGYPGQFTPNATVYIQNSHNIIGNTTITGAGNRLKDLIFSAGAGASSLTISSSNSIQVQSNVIVFSGANRDINVGAGFLSVGSFSFNDTGSDSIVSKLSVSTGAIFVDASLTMLGSSIRNIVEFTGSGGELFFTKSGTMTGGTLIPASGTVYYSGTFNQTVGSYGYSNLVLKGSLIKTVPATVTISSNLWIDEAASASLATGITYVVGTLTLGCRDSEDGTWGSTMSGPTYPNDVYFQPTTGIINVSTDTSLKIPATAGLQPTCASPTVSITVTVQYPGQEYSFDNGVSWQTSNVMSGLSAGTYTVIIRNSKLCNSPTRTVTLVTPVKTWNGSANTDWSNAANWTPNGVPTVDTCVEIANNVTVTGNYTGLGHNLTVLNGGSLTVNSNNNLKITDVVNVNAGGSLTCENNASLVQVNNVANTGAITYKRTTTTLLETDYTYWSSPIAGQNLLAVSPTTKLDKFYSFDASADDWVQLDAASTTMTLGKGYIVRGIPVVSPAPPGFPESSFIGVPNNGNIDIAAVGSISSNLLGNPYPSAINADPFILANSTKIDGTLYFWTHKTPIAVGAFKPGTGAKAYTSNDYASYNLSGGVATAGNYTPEWVDANKNGIVDSGEFIDKNGNSILETSEWVDSNSDLTFESGEWTDANSNRVAETGEWTDTNADGILDLPGEWIDANSDGIKDFDEWTDTNANGIFNTGEWNDINFDKMFDLEVEQISNTPTGKIAAGQGFFTTSTVAGGQVSFTNSMRVDGSGNVYNNSNFYKTKNPKTKTAFDIEKHRVWLNLTNKGGAFKQTLVGYITGATNAWDSLYDGKSYDGNEFVDFYSINEGINLVIQGRALPFDENDEVPLGYRSAITGEFSIGIEQVDGLLANHPVFLEDKLTNVIVNLKTSKYSFTTAVGVFDNRFVLRYKDKTLGTNDVLAQSNKVLISIKNKQIKINSFAETIYKVTIYDFLGRQIYQKDKVSSNELILSNFVSSHQTLIVKTTLQNGEIVSDKIIY